MYILLRLSNGRLMEGVLLALEENRMRVAVRGNSETIDFQFAGSCWLGDNGDSVQIESIVTPGRTELPRVTAIAPAKVPAKVMGATH